MKLLFWLTRLKSDEMKFIPLMETNFFLMRIHYPDKKSLPWWNDESSSLMTMKEFIYSSDETLKGTYLGIVDSSLWWIFITLIKLKNMMKTHYSWKIHPSEFIAMLKIHYSDKASLLIRNSSPWWITLF